jgi:predicted anti-sigma-YlaC factor YlaD
VAGAPRLEAASPGMIARWGLVMVALAQACLAIPALLGTDAGAPVHVAHEQGAWALALAVALMAVAWQPRRAAALLPFVAALAGGLALTMVVDIAAGRTQAAAEAPHGLAFLGLAMLWLLSRQTPQVARQRQPTVPTPGMARAA